MNKEKGGRSPRGLGCRAQKIPLESTGIFSAAVRPTPQAIAESESLTASLRSLLRSFSPCTNNAKAREYRSGKRTGVQDDLQDGGVGMVSCPSPPALMRKRLPARLWDSSSIA